MTKISLWGKQMIYLLCWKMKDLSNTSTFSKLHRNTCSHTVKCAQLSYPLRPCGLQPVRLLCPWDSPGKNPGVGSCSLLQGIFPTQGLNPGLLWILYHLSHQGSPRILGWVAYPFSRGSFQPRNRTGVSCITGRFFTS